MSLLHIFSFLSAQTLTRPHSIIKSAVCHLFIRPPAVSNYTWMEYYVFRPEEVWMEGACVVVNKKCFQLVEYWRIFPDLMPSMQLYFTAISSHSTVQLKL